MEALKDYADRLMRATLKKIRPGTYHGSDAMDDDGFGNGPIPIEVAIRIGGLSDTSAIATRIGALRRLVVAAPAYLKRRGEPRTPDELANHDIISFAGIDGVARWTFGGGIEAPIKPRLIVSTAEASIDAAVSGL